MNTINRQPIPLRPDRTALARAALTSVARFAILAARSPGKRTAAENPWPDDCSVEWLTRAAVAPTKIADAAGLAQLAVSFLASLVPMSASAAVLARSIGVSFDDTAQISFPGVTLPAAAWVGEGGPIPVAQGVSSTAASLVPTKLAVIVPLSREMVEGANAEAIMTQVLIENIGGTLDTTLFSANAAVAATSPAGLLNGIAALTATAAGSGAMVGDISALAQALGAVSGASDLLLVANPRQAAVIRLTAISDPFVVLPCNAIADKTIIGIAPAAIVSAIGAPQISASIETTVHMASPAGDLVASPSTVAAPQRGMFQTDSLALRFILPANWARRGNVGVAWVQNTNW